MAWLTFITAIGLLFVFEGIMPFLSPSFWRKLMVQMTIQNDRILRIMGLSSMLIGLAIVTLARYLF